jgi:hypothetical protein
LTSSPGSTEADPTDTACIRTIPGSDMLGASSAFLKILLELPHVDSGQIHRGRSARSVFFGFVLGRSHAAAQSQGEDREKQDCVLHGPPPVRGGLPLFAADFRGQVRFENLGAMEAVLWEAGIQSKTAFGDMILPHKPMQVNTKSRVEMRNPSGKHGGGVR